MKKLISLLSVLFLLTLFMPLNQTEAARGSGGSRGTGGRGGFHGGYGRSHGVRGHEEFHGHRGFLPGVIIGGALGWSLWPYYYPPDYYYYPPPTYYYPPPAQSSQVQPSASQESGGKLFIYPREGQSEEKKAEDVAKCNDWAVGQTGFDPSKVSDGAPDTQTIQKSRDYFRAISACLDAHGYTVR